MFPGSHHNGRGLIAWADSHVEARTWTDHRTLGTPDCSAPDTGSIKWHEHRQPSSDNPDLRWLLSHASVTR
ncbi:MAG: hypothetical protein FJ398_06600 [Verrucomicrobia bacterium]|nr:hypothetical protein [Verrucomicrobiota bacterium]